MNVKQITSHANPTLKDIRKLRTRKGRNQQQRYLLEGIRIVGDALHHHAPVTTLIYCPELLTSEFANDLIQTYANQVDEVLELSADTFHSLALKDNPQGIAAVVGAEPKVLGNLILGKDDIWVVLDTIRDPGNLGTILRTLDAVGGTGVILLDDCVDEYDPTTIRASMGGLFTQAIFHATTSEFIQWSKVNNVQVVGTSDHAGTRHYREIKFHQPTLLMMGSERAGLTDELLSICEDMIYIPMFGSCDSLNLAVATGIVLYEVADQLKGREK